MPAISISRQQSFNSPSASARPLNIKKGNAEISILISYNFWDTAEQLREDFQVISLPEPIATDDLLEVELIALFLQFVIERIDPTTIQIFYPVLTIVFNQLSTVYLKNNDVHAATRHINPYTRNIVIQAYYNALTIMRKEGTLQDNKTPASESALLKAVRNKEASIFAVFGGQGNTDDYFKELVDLFDNYEGFVRPFMVKASNLFKEYCQDKDAIATHSKGMDVINWIENPETKPDNAYLLSASVSLPLYGLIHLTHYLVTFKILGMSPEYLRNHFVGSTGHSQGIVPATVIASATTEEDYYQKSLDALGLLFWTGTRAQQVYPPVTLNPSLLKDSISNGEGHPNMMLTIFNLSLEELQGYVKTTNEHLPQERQIYINLVNGPRSFVCAGHPQSLNGLNLALRKIKAPAGLDQSRVPHSKRKVKFNSQYLPITGPFHSPYLKDAVNLTVQDAKRYNICFKREDVAIPVYSTEAGRDLRESEDLTLDLVEQMDILPVIWEKATSSNDYTHIVEFGPGGTSGVGALTYRNKEGTGVHVILASTLQGNNSKLGYKGDLFDKNPASVKFSPNWAKTFQPKLVKVASTGKMVVDTKMSQLLGKPPLMVAGMTPCTVATGFNAAAINAGYHIELAGGGHFTEKMFRDKVDDIMKLIQPGESITVNILFLNAFQWNFQFPLIQAMRREGYPIEGVTVAAGVPSPDVANDIVSKLLEVGIKHIAFKPGSVDTIKQVVKIAASNPKMSVILQWTGGRAGGHHSFEDLHQPILQTYSLIRQQTNLVLVAGSGFGGSEDTLPYITGDWSLAFNYPHMPFDGILFGSRMMVAKESLAADEVKQAIVDAPGVEDAEWEKSYTQVTGGVLTVKSELGEPIHKIATKGIKFWKEMDDKIFSLPRDKRPLALEAKRDYIIQHLNEDFQKVWFGKNSKGDSVELNQMTYAEVANRLIELTYVNHESRWIDISLRRFVGDFLRRLEERFVKSEKPSLIQDYNQLNIPSEFLPSFLEAYPESKNQLLTTEDVQYFLTQCLRRDQKPVPFIPILDNNFEFWFKKDSLWQSEDLQAVPGQDVQRAAILQGPIAAKYSTKINQPLQEILDEINQGHINYLLERYYDNDVSKIPTVEYVGGAANNYTTNLLKGVTTHIDSNGSDNFIYTTSSSSSNLPEASQWLELLAGNQLGWLRALLTSKAIVQGYKQIENPLRRVFRPRHNQKAIVNKSGDKVNSISVFDVATNSEHLSVKAELVNDTTIDLTMFEKKESSGTSVPLKFSYNYKPEQGYASIHEVMEGRNERIKAFYFGLWWDDERLEDFTLGATDKFIAKDEIVDRKDITRFCHSVGNHSELYVDRGKDNLIAPLDFAIVVGWKAVIKTLFPKTIDGDLLRLVHLSNGFRMLGDAPLKDGDVVDTSAEITAIINNDSGKIIQVKGTIQRDGKDVLQISSEFLYRGNFKDYENTFRNVKETPMEVTLSTTKDIAVLQSKPWFVWEREDIQLTPNSTITFNLSTHAKYKSSTVYSEITTTGSIVMQVSSKEFIQVGSVHFQSGESYGNPVLEYLKRVGIPLDQETLLESGGYSVIPEGDDFNYSVHAPVSNVSYAQVSRDLNPIHVNPYFSDLAGLPGTITHGMWTSASTRKLIEVFAADNHPLRVKAYKVNFVDMVLPNDVLETKLRHIGMQKGRKVIRVETFNQHGTKVLEGTAEVDQPVTAYVFTGQGSQEVGMGMDLYNSSPIAKGIWDRADHHYLTNYGFSLLDIVKNNPKSKTVFFGGSEGKKVRQRYLDMTYEIQDEEGNSVTLPLFPEINENSESYTFVSPTGLLSSTQFTQPALTLLEKASFEDMRAKGLINENSAFAGHSLGEYSSLSSIGNVFPIEQVIDLVFYRGMTMQSAVIRDEKGRSNFGMIAVNPTRVSSSLNQTLLEGIVEAISSHTKGLLQIVNYNVENWQYVVSGDLTNLDMLANVLDYIKFAGVDFKAITANFTPEQLAEKLQPILEKAYSATLAKKESQNGPIILARSQATIPLGGIDVPFHSKFLLSGVNPFRNFLLSKLKPNYVDVNKLTNKYIPNLTAKPFQLTKEYFEDVYKLTNSPLISKVAKNWDEKASLTPTQQQQLGHLLLVELLAFQFASPVRWIETQDQLFISFKVERLIEVGPSPTLSGMADRTLKLKYAAYDDALAFQRVTLCSYKNEKEIYYTQADEEVAPAVEATLPIPAAVQTPIPAQAAPVQQVVSSGPVAKLDDVPIPAIDILHAVVAQKLKKDPSQIPITNSLKELVGGKSTLQNEILGDLQKEFGSAVPEKSEETPLNELGDQINSSASGTLGKHSSGAISKLVASKMPGGFTMTNVKAHLANSYGLGPLRTDAVLLLGLTREPASRFASEVEAKAWLDSVAQAYASKNGISLSSGSSGSGGAVGSSGTAIDSAAFDAFNQKQFEFYKRQINLIHGYIGEDQNSDSVLVSTNKALIEQLQSEIDSFHAEHGEFYVKGVRPVFDFNKVRRYDSYWNWVRQDLINLYYDVVFGRITDVNRDITAQCIHIMNRADTSILDVVRYMIDQTPINKGENYKLAKTLGEELYENIQVAINAKPVYKNIMFPTGPKTEISAKGDIIYSEVHRPEVRKLSQYVTEMRQGTKLSNLGFRNLLIKLAKSQNYKNVDFKQVNDKPLFPKRVVHQIRGKSANKASKPKSSLVPLLHLKKKDFVNGWQYNSKLTNTFLDVCMEVAEQGVSFEGKNVLITGCGRNSIGAEIVCGLLSGGAQIIVTTSRFSREATEYYQNLYCKYGSKGSALIVLPFNQGSKQDVQNLVDYIYSLDDKQSLKWDLDFVIPFAAIPENGREISDIDEVSEFSHRAMMTNLYRLLGCIKDKKHNLGYRNRPAQVILPLSQNHGLFGGDGLYSESKLSLENLLNRWHSESWSKYLTVVGAIIGWTRGTGLMNQNNIVAQGIEQLGVRTFSTPEMAFNILALMHPTVVNLAQLEPVWADLNGGLQYLPNLKLFVSNLRQQLTETSEIRGSVSQDNGIDFSVVNGAKATASYQIHKVTPRANLTLNFPELKQYEALEHVRHMENALDLNKVVVVTGYGEVGPWGSSRTRWEFEAHGEFSLEGCIEMAWMTGKIKHFNGTLKSGQQYTGWVDSKTNEPVKDCDVKKKYEAEILKHSGVRLIEPELFDGYNPENYTLFREVVIDQDLEPIEVSEEEAAQFKRQHKDKVHVQETKDGSFRVTLLKGASLHVPKALKFDRLVAGQIPTGWSPQRYGIPEDIISQVDELTLFTLVSTVEALVSSGITDPYEFYKYIHVSELGNVSGSGLGGASSFSKMYIDRLMDKPVQSDILQETFINTIAAWINLLLMSSSGPIKTPVGACATAVESVEIGVDTIVSGKAKVVLAGGFDNFSKEGSLEFANMKATSNSIEEFAKGRTPQEMSRPSTTSRAGFMDAQGSGMHVMMSAAVAIEMGVPIYAIVALTNTATDKEGRSVPAPGQGVLTTARELQTKYPSPLLDFDYRKRQITKGLNKVKTWADEEYSEVQLQVESLKKQGQLQTESEELDFLTERTAYITKEVRRQENHVYQLWSNDFFKQDETIAPLRGALAVYNLTVDDIGVASFHGTGTAANDKNESDVLNKQLTHLGRTKGNVCPSIFQKYLTGHPKGAAAAFMLNGMIQVLNTGIIPGNRNADNIDTNFKKFDNVLYLSRSIHTDGIKAGILKSFGFGQVGGEVLVIHPDYLLGALSRQDYQAYSVKNQARLTKSYRYLHNSMTGVEGFVQVKHQPPYSEALESQVYLNPKARATYDKVNKSYQFQDAKDNSTKSTTDVLLTKEILTKLQPDSSNVTSKGVGIDVELLSAINVENSTFLERNFTPQEIEYCNSRPDPQASFTGKWAAKEAVIKAITSLNLDGKPAFSEFGAGAPLKGIEIVASNSGAPKVVLDPKVKEIAANNNANDFKVTISHSGEYAVALAVVTN